MDSVADRDELALWAEPGQKHVLQLIQARRFRTVPTEALDGDGADLLLFQASQNLKFTPMARTLPTGAWRRARQGLGKVVFDASMEGKAHTPEASQTLHGLLDDVGVPLERAVYLTQDRQYAADYAAWCARLGIKRPMKVVVYDYWARRTLAAFQHTGAQAFERRLGFFKARGRTRERRFLSLNFTPRPTRLVFLSRLMRDGLMEQGFVSFGGFDQMVRRKGQSFHKIRQGFLELPGFEDETLALEPFLHELAGRGQFLLGRFPEDQHRYGAAIRDQALAEYGLSWFSIITETEMRDRPCRITEKPLKPLLNFHPLVIFGNPGSLQLIRDMGFQSFPELVDESYDEEPDPRRRFDMAYGQVRRLCALDEAELERTGAALSEKLASNAEFGLTRLPRIYRDEIDRTLMAELLG